MFTGIVEGQGHVESIAPHGAAYRFVAEVGALAQDVRSGDSVAIDGTCLTAVAVRPPRIEFDVVSETVERTAFASVRVGDRVNVERSMRADGRFHGHFVQGHVDGTGRVVVKRKEAGQTWVVIEVVRPLAGQMIEKGPIGVDGVSLTIAALTDTSFSVAVIPHTLLVTTLGWKGEGSLVNVEVDCLGKWIRRPVLAQLRGEAPGPAPPGPAPGQVVLPSVDALGLTFEDLRRAGLE